MSSKHPPPLFNRRLYAHRRSRAATNFSDYNFLHQRAMEDIVDRLQTVTRSFPKALFYGVGELAKMLIPECGIDKIVHGDLTVSRLQNKGNRIVFDEENSPFANKSFDLIISLMTLHNSNDLIGALAQMRTQLRPDGLLIAVLFGENTLSTLRKALYRAETNLMGGVSPRIIPFANIRDLGACLQRAGFALPVADMDSVAVTYRDWTRLFTDLRGMGETSALRQQGKPMTRSLFAETLTELSKAGNKINFDFVFLTGWAPHSNQQKPLKPGTSASSLEAGVKLQNKK